MAELLAALSLGIDLGFGQPMEHVLRQCRIALRLCELLELRDDERVAVYYTADVRAGRLEHAAVDAVLRAAGHRVGRRRGGPAGLTAREVEVLQLLARGCRTSRSRRGS